MTQTSSPLSFLIAGDVASSSDTGRLPELGSVGLRWFAGTGAVEEELVDSTGN